MSIVGGVKHDKRPTIRTNPLYPNKIVENFGTHVMKTAFASHANGMALMTFPVYNNASWTFDHDPAALREMLNWGITNRMQKIYVSPALGVVMTKDNLIINEQAAGTTGRRNTGNHDNGVRNTYDFCDYSYVHQEDTANFSAAENEIFGSHLRPG